VTAFGRSSVAITDLTRSANIQLVLRSNAPIDRAMRQAWMRVNYLIAIALATLAWLYFVVWVVRGMF
jgi:hypothetical protein